MSLIQVKRLSEAQRHELEVLLHATHDIRVYRRVQVILWKDDGYGEDEIQERTGYSKRAQWWWLSRYARSGVKGLFDKPRSGRPRQSQKPTPPKPVAPSAKGSLTYWARVT